MPGLQLANKMFLVFSEYPSLLYFSRIVLPSSVTVIMLMGVWLVAIQSLLHWVWKSEVLVLLNSKFDCTKVGLADKMLQLELLLALLESYAINVVAGSRKGKESTNRDIN